MRLFIVLLTSLCFVDASLFLGKSLRQTSFGLKYFHSTYLQRMKRQITNGMQSNIIECAISCIVPTIYMIVDESLASINRQHDFTQGKTNQDLERFCRIFRNASNCRDACRYRPLKDSLSDASTVLKFICVDRYQEFKRHLSCLNQATAESGFRCTTQCAKLDALEAFFFNQINYRSRKQRSTSLNDLDQTSFDNFLGELLKQSCQYSNCSFDCMRSIVITQCGNEAQKLVKDFIAINYATLEKAGATFGVNLTLPPECLQLAKTSREVEKKTSSNGKHFAAPMNINGIANFATLTTPSKGQFKNSSFSGLE